MIRNQYSAGIVILLAGIAILLGRMGVFSFIGSVFWPLFILVPGILLHVLYFGRLLPAAALVPGGILSVYALVFLFCNWFGWGYMNYLWPFFILGLAVGLYEYYTFDSSHPRSAFTIAAALAGVWALCMIFVLLWSWGIYLIAFALVALGGWMMVSKKARW
ncbi:hypothetical protein ACTHPH_09195 [Paenibacillus pasadenensis]|uniref:DUF5668 domain-containing protein n=1 Tax=Paenibacillus pasadenensis TaxID=217090 RepID=A0A2N5N849_9BACL|nr:MULTISPECIES: hypothetical protein [Paenibacillus]PLT46512.1 hypothetical protein B8V81_4943 [Paenibacillus pasadenensis]QGG56918.1 hypothetical protein GE073_15890 [Paenibacillus sp. B01]